MKKIFLISVLIIWPYCAWAHGTEEYLFIFLPIVAGVVLALAGVATLIYGIGLKNQKHAVPLKIQILKYFFKKIILIFLVLMILWLVLMNLWGLLRVLGTLLV